MALVAISLALFAWLLTLVPTDAAGRAFAAYGGVYICASLVWMAAVEKTFPDRWDLIGGAVCLAGAAVILGANAYIAHREATLARRASSEAASSAAKPGE